MKPNPGSAFRKFTIAVAVVTVVGSTSWAIDHATGTIVVSPRPRGNCGCNYSNDVALDVVWSSSRYNNECERDNTDEVDDSSRMWRRRQMEKKNRKRKFSQRLKAFHLLTTLLLLLSLPADNAVFIHPCSFPSGHPSINLCAARVSVRDGGEKSSSCEKGFSLAKAIHFDNNTTTTRTWTENQQKETHMSAAWPSLYFFLYQKAKGPSFFRFGFSHSAQFTTTDSLTDGQRTQRTIIRVADKIIALMSSPRWERAEVDNLETISQTKKEQGGEEIPSKTRTVRENNKKKFLTQSNNNNNNNWR